MAFSSIDVSIIVPVYNSSKIIRELVSRVDKAMLSTAIKYELILADDYSSDNSWQVIRSVCESNKRVLGVRLSKNSGQWCSTLAGMSKSSGKYIVTIDDDLEYEPDDIPNLYTAIINNNYYTVFGIAKEKYFLQGKNQKISLWRKKLMHTLWNSPTTDSFRILNRTLVFKQGQFIPNIFIDAYIVNNLDKQFLGYLDVRFNKRYAGKSNISMLKKIKLFFLYASHFHKNHLNNIALFIFMIIILVPFVVFLFTKTLLWMSLSLMFILISIKASSVLSLNLKNNKKASVYAILKETN
jgi:glycosyltransferase involved in cell wall biosynthesis